MSAVPVTTSAVRAAESAALLYERHHGRILAFCLRRLRNREEAEDAAQQVFLKAFGALRGGFVPAVERAWLYRIAENVCTDRLRANGRRVRHEASDGGAILELTPARDAAPIEGLEEALAGLTPAQRRALLLREWQGLSYREIAAELELSQSAVETLLFRARRSLAKRLDAVPLLAWLKSALLCGSGAKTAAVVAVTVGVGAAAVAPVVVDEGSTERARTPIQLAQSVARERIGEARQPGRPRAVPRVPERAEPTQEMVRGGVDGQPIVSKPSVSAPSAASGPGRASPTHPVAAASEPALPTPVPVPVAKAPVGLPSVPVPEVELLEPTEVPVLGPVVAPVVEPVQGAVDGLSELAPALP